MKNIIALLFLFPLFLNSQNVGIGTPSPHISAKLDVESTTGGVLIPRLTTVERNDIPSPVKGLLIFNSETNRFEFYNGAAWQAISSSVSSKIADTDEDTFIDVEKTADEDSIRFMVDGYETMKMDNKTLHLASPGKATLLGYQAGQSTPVSDNWNTIVGYQAGQTISSGISNTMVGSFSGQSFNTGSSNAFFGLLSGSNGSGSNNTFLGAQAGQNTSIGANNSYIGASAGGFNSGSDNIAIGFFAARAASGNNTIAIGKAALGIATKGENIAIGDSTLYKTGQGGGIFPIQGSRNTAIGFKSMRNNGTGFNNTSLGYLSLNKNSSGANNTAMGASSSEKLTTGSGNVSIGSVSLIDNETGNNNVAVGNESGKFAKGGNNTFIGSKTGVNNLEGSGNVFIGNSAGENNTESDKLIITNSAVSPGFIEGKFDDRQLSIDGSLKISNDTITTHTVSDEGLIRWNDEAYSGEGDFEGYTGTEWLSFTGGNESRNPCEHGIVIDTLPYIITEPGYYYLENNLTYTDVSSFGGSGISIDTNFVTLDLRGYKIRGTLGSLTQSFFGITVNGTNVTVANGGLENWDTGIRINGDNNRIKNCKVKSNAYGLTIFSSNGNVVKDCSINLNSYIGLRILGDGSGNVISNNSITANVTSNIQFEPAGSITGGIVLNSGSKANYIVKNNIANNKRYGIILRGQNILEGNVVSGSTNPNVGGTTYYGYYYFNGGGGDDGAWRDNYGYDNDQNVFGVTPPPERSLNNWMW